MNRLGMSVLIGGTLVALGAGPAFAFRCPALVKECQTTADVVAKRDGSDAATVEKARKGCDEAMKLHEEKKHKESMVRAGQAIADVSKALK